MLDGTNAAGINQLVGVVVMNKPFSYRVLCVALLALTVAGCEPAEPEKSMLDMISAGTAVADCLEGVKDAESARAVVGELDSRYGNFVTAGKDFYQNVQKHKDAKISQSRVTELKAEAKRAGDRVKTQGQRLEGIHGLPIEFWKVVNVRSVEVLIVALEGMPNAPECQRDVPRRIRDMMAASRIRTIPLARRDQLARRFAGQGDRADQAGRA